MDLFEVLRSMPPGGWASDDAVQDRIDDMVLKAVMAVRARMPMSEKATHCLECGDLVQEGRRIVFPGVRTCVPCQSGRDVRVVASGINRRGSKDSQ